MRTTRSKRRPPRFWDVERLSSRLDDCAQNHSCGGSGKTELPTRLLDLRGPEQDRIRLIITRDALDGKEDVRYAALSYCWGAGTPFTTEPSTLGQRLRGFSVVDLPLTLQEAVRVARELGIRYLWIDALCILQGSRDDVVAQDDWRRESARMHLVYGNAYVTIVAAAARHCHEGLLCGKAYLVKPRVSRSNEPEVQVYLDKTGFQPISARAWALQEWMLSSRLMVFSTWGAQYYCDQHKTPAIQSCFSERLLRSPSSVGEFDWQLIVMHLCSRSMKEPGDKLPALAGLAQRFCSLRNWPGQDYLSGVWKETLLGDLLWLRSANHNRVLGLPKARATARRDRAPSWSWASIDGDVHYLRTRMDSLESTEVRKCEVTLAAEGDTFGAVRSGVLAIHCRYVKAWLRPPDPRPFSNVWKLHDSHDHEVGQCHMDVDDEFEVIQAVSEPGDDGTAFYCLVLAVDHPDIVGSGSRSLRGIVVKRDEDKTTYVRVGSFDAVEMAKVNTDDDAQWTEGDFSVV